MVISNSKCIRQEKRSSRKPESLIYLINRGDSMWKPYVKWKSNLILLRLAAHLVDGQKLTRGLAIYLIGHKIRVCTSLFSMEPHSFMPPVPSHRKWRRCCGTFLHSHQSFGCTQRAGAAHFAQHSRSCSTAGAAGAARVLLCVPVTGTALPEPPLPTGHSL